MSAPYPYASIRPRADSLPPPPPALVASALRRQRGKTNLSSTQTAMPQCINAQVDSGQQPPATSHPPAWLASTPVVGPNHLHMDIVRLSELARPNVEEVKHRQGALQLVQHLLLQAGCHLSDLFIFGSSATGLSLPSSDIDIGTNVAGPKQQPGSPLTILCSADLDNDTRRVKQ